MRISTVALITLASFTVADAARVKQVVKTPKIPKIPKMPQEEMVTCRAVGQESGGRTGGGAGMSVTWGVPKNECRKRCGPTSSRGGLTYERQFTTAFEVSFDKKCQCSAGGKVVATFKAKDEAQAEECADGTSGEVHEACWEQYKRARGTRFEHYAQGTRSIPLYKVPFTHSDFVVENLGCSEPCDECDAIVVPGVLDDMDPKDLVAVGEAIKQIMDGNGDTISGALKQLIDALPDDDLDAAEIAFIDPDGDGPLSVETLSNYYVPFTPAQIKKFVDAADDNGNGELDPYEFPEFKEQMRSFSVGHWECMKEGKSVPAEECEPM